MMKWYVRLWYRTLNPARKIGLDKVHYLCTIQLLNAIYSRPSKIDQFHKNQGVVAARWFTETGLSKTCDPASFMSACAKQYWVRRIYLRDLSKAPRARGQVLAVENEFQPHKNGTILVHSASQFTAVLDAEIKKNGGLRQGIEDGHRTLDDQQKVLALSMNLAKCLTMLKHGKAVVMTPEGRYGNDSVELPFLEGTYTFMTGLAKLAIRSQAQIVPVHINMQSDGTLKICYERPWTFSETQTDTLRERAITTCFANWLAARWMEEPASVDPHYMEIFLKETAAKAAPKP